MLQDYYELHKIVEEYKSKKESTIFISDWDTTELIERPLEILEFALLSSLSDADRYYFIEENQGKRIFIEYCNTNFSNTIITEEKFIISPNATMSISLAVMALKSMNIKNFLALTPVYFTFDVIFNALDCNYSKFPIEGTKIDIDKLENEIVQNNIESIIVTDPLYGSGISFSDENYYLLFELAKKYNLWIILDYARGGFYWDRNKLSLFDFQKYKKISFYPRCIFIDSVSKRLFINGFKTSILLSTKEIISRCEKLADGFVGSICASEIRLFENIFASQNQKELLNILHNNIEKAKSCYQLLKSITLGSNILLSEPEDGNYCLCLIPKTQLEQKDDFEIFKALLYKYNIYTLPQSLYHIEDSVYYKFRINLLLEKKSLINAITILSNSI